MSRSSGSCVPGRAPSSTLQELYCLELGQARELRAHLDSLEHALFGDIMTRLCPQKVRKGPPVVDMLQLSVPGMLHHFMDTKFCKWPVCNSPWPSEFTVKPSASPLPVCHLWWHYVLSLLFPYLWFAFFFFICVWCLSPFSHGTLCILANFLMYSLKWGEVSSLHLDTNTILNQ